MQLRLIAILDQSKVAWGDQANTINSVANQYRILKAQGANLARMFGSLFIPMLQSVLPYINAVVMGLQRLVQWVASILHIDMGKNMAGISKAYSGGADDMEGLADASDDASDSLDKANGSAKALAKTVLGFDEINALSDNSNKSSGSGAGGIDLSGPIGNLLNDYNDAWNKALNSSKNKAQELLDKLMKYVNAGDWKGLGTLISTKLRDALNSIPWNKVYAAAENFGKGLADFLNGLIRPDTFYALGRTIANSLNTAFHFLDSFAKEFNWANLGDSVAAGIKGALTNIDWPLIFDTMKNFGTGLATFLNHLFTPETFSLVGKTIANYLNAALTFLYNFADTLNWKDIGNSIATGINSFFDTFNWTLLAQTLNKWVLGLDTAIATAITKINWGKLISGIFTTLSHIDWKTYATLVAAVAVPAIVKTFFDYFILQLSLKFGIGAAGQMATIIASALTKAGASEAVAGASTAVGGSIATSLLVGFKSGMTGIGAFLSMGILDKNLGGNATNKNAEALANTDFGKQSYSMLNGGKTPNNNWAQESEKSIKENAENNKKARAQDLLNQLQFVADSKNILTGYSNDSKKITSDSLANRTSQYSAWSASTKSIASGTYTDLKTLESSYLGQTQDKWNGFSSGVKFAFDNADTTVSNSTKNMSANIGKLPTALSNASNSTHSYLKDTGDTWNGFSSGIKFAFDGASNSVASSSSSMTTNAGKLPVAFSDAGTKAGVALFTNIQPGLTSFAQKVGALPSNISGGLETLKNNVGSAATQAGTGLSTNFNAGKDSFLSKVASLPGTANRNISPLIEYLRSAGSNAINGLHNGFNNGIGDFINTVGSIPGRIYNALSGMYNIGQSIIRSLINGLQSINIPTPHFNFGSTTKRIAGHNIDFPSISFDGWYANGGFPSTGDVFVANENAPELVGKMGNKTTVANNKQITDGIKSAVEEAMANVMVAFSSKGSNNSTTPVEVTVVASNETLYRQVVKGKQSYDGRVHVVVPV